jgi:uncharacterized RDD family membrane protein YckC
MNEHDPLEPTAAIPRIVPPSSPPPDAPRTVVVPPPIPTQTPRPAPSLRPTYRFGNPLTYALRRFAAFTLDAVLVTSVVTSLLYGLIAVNPLTGLPTNSEGGFDATLGMGLASAALYLWIFEAIAGTTLGKLAFSLHIYVPRRRFVGLGRSLIRNLIRPIDALVIGWILAMAPGHRRLGDLLGGTLVADSPLRAFSPLVGWVLIVALGALPFVVAGGMVTVVAVAAATVEFVPPLVARIAHVILPLVVLPPLHPATPPTG